MCFQNYGKYINIIRIFKQGIWLDRGIKEGFFEEVLRFEGCVSVSEEKREGVFEVKGGILQKFWGRLIW